MRIKIGRGWDRDLDRGWREEAREAVERRLRLNGKQQTKPEPKEQASND